MNLGFQMGIFPKFTKIDVHRNQNESQFVVKDSATVFSVFGMTY